MEYRAFGKTGWKVSSVGFGAWAIGGTWGRVDDDESLKALHTALDNGVNLFDTADVYGDGRKRISILSPRQAADWTLTLSLVMLTRK